MIDLLNGNNCESILNSFIERQRCKCSFGAGASIVSTNTNRIACIRNEDIDKGKYTGILFNSPLFSS